MFLQEAGDDFLTEEEADPPFALPPTLNVLVGICPEQIAKQTRIGHIRRPDDLVDLLQVREFR